MKKSLIFVAIMVAATTLFAETVTCESKMGKCTYEITSNGNYSEDCICRDGCGRGEGGNYDMPTTLPTEEECLANLEKKCKDAGFKCENEAGECYIDQNGEYGCNCKGVWSANGAVEGGYHGTAEFNEETSEEENCNRLVEICGTEPATVRSVCDDDPETANKCVSDIKIFAETCFDPLTDEDIEGIFDQQAYGYGREWPHMLSDCCQMEQQRKDFQTRLECLENCKDDNCCETCHVKVVPHDDEITSSEDDSNKEEVTATGTTPPAEDSADSEKKEESKSDGCSMLFI